MLKERMARSSINSSVTKELSISTLSIYPISAANSEANLSNAVTQLLSGSPATSNRGVEVDSRAIEAGTPTSDFISFESSGHMEPLIIAKSSQTREEIISKSSASVKSNSEFSQPRLNFKRNELNATKATSAIDTNQLLKVASPAVGPGRSSQHGTYEQSFVRPIMEPKTESILKPTSNSGIASANIPKESSTSGSIGQQAKFRALPPKDLETVLLKDPFYQDEMIKFMASQRSEEKPSLPDAPPSGC